MSPPDPEPETVIDEKAINRPLQLIEDDRDALRELVEDFAGEAPRAVATMRQATATGDWKAMGIAAHSLKWNARDFGALDLSERCGSLERACKEGVPEAPADIVARIDDEARRAVAALGAFV